MSFSDELRNALAKAAETRAIRAIPPWDQSVPPGGEGSACIARIAHGSGTSESPLPPDSEVASWSEDALFVYRERLAIASDQGMDISPGSEAELIARREARRAHAGIPADFGQSRAPDIFDAALEAFVPLGGLTFTHSEPPLPSTLGEDAGTQQPKDPNP